MELHMVTSKPFQLDHKPTWSCIRVTADTGVTRISPVACLEPSGSNVVTLFDALLNVYTVGENV